MTSLTRPVSPESDQSHQASLTPCQSYTRPVLNQASLTPGQSYTRPVSPESDQSHTRPVSPESDKSHQASITRVTSLTKSASPESDQSHQASLTRVTSLTRSASPESDQSHTRPVSPESDQSHQATLTRVTSLITPVSSESDQSHQASLTRPVSLGSRRRDNSRRLRLMLWRNIPAPAPIPAQTPSKIFPAAFSPVPASGKMYRLRLSTSELGFDISNFQPHLTDLELFYSRFGGRESWTLYFFAALLRFGKSQPSHTWVLKTVLKTDI